MATLLKRQKGKCNHCGLYLIVNLQPHSRYKPYLHFYLLDNRDILPLLHFMIHYMDWLNRSFMAIAINNVRAASHSPLASPNQKTL
jgi:hypothetical protein